MGLACDTFVESYRQRWTDHFFYIFSITKARSQGYSDQDIIA